MTLTSNLTRAAAIFFAPLLQRRARHQHGRKRKERRKEGRLSRSGPAALEGSLGGPFRLSTKNTIYRLDVHRTTDVRQPSLIYKGRMQPAVPEAYLDLVLVTHKGYMGIEPRGAIQ